MGLLTARKLYNLDAFPAESTEAMDAIKNTRALTEHLLQDLTEHPRLNLASIRLTQAGCDLDLSSMPDGKECDTSLDFTLLPAALEELAANYVQESIAEARAAVYRVIAVTYKTPNNDGRIAMLESTLLRGDNVPKRIQFNAHGPLDMNDFLSGGPNSSAPARPYLASLANTADDVGDVVPPRCVS